MIDYDRIRVPASGTHVPTSVLFVLFTCVAVSIALADDGEQASSANMDEVPVLAMDGYCPVTYQTDGQAVRGDAQFAVKHRGKLYHLASSDAKKKFEAEPDRFAPQYDGFCAASLGGIKGLYNTPDPEVFVVREGKLYLFASPRHRNVFVNEPDKFISKADFRFLAIRGFCPVSYLSPEGPKPGDAKYFVIRKGHKFQFTSEASKAAFIASPEKYIPQYGMNCAYGMSRREQNGVNPTLYTVIDGKTYLFLDQDAKEKFNANQQRLLPQADQNWQSLRND